MQLFLHIGFTLVGLYFILIGWRIIRPKQTDTWVATFNEWGWLFRYGGIGIAIVGGVQVIMELRGV